MNKSHLAFLFIAVFILPIYVFSQDTIYFVNPSFEDIPRMGTQSSPVIKGWTDCGFPGESPVDIHPTPGKAWGVDKRAKDGLTYLGLVTRYNLTWEAVSQQLAHPLKADSCYTLTAALAIFGNYNSNTRRSEKPESFSHPVVFQIWGGADHGNRGELLGKSPPINNTEWKEFSFLLKPTFTWEYVVLEAFYYFPSNIGEGDKEAYNGHILLDNLSPIIQVECNY